MASICATRILKNAKQIRAIAPEIFAAKEPNQGFNSVVPIDILGRFESMSSDELKDLPELQAVKLKLQQQSAAKGISPDGLIFSDPSFKGTAYLVKLTFRKAGTTVVVSDADMTTILQYLQMAAPAIAMYASQYGSNRLAVSSRILTMAVDVPSGKYDNDALQDWVRQLFKANLDLKPAESCFIFINPPGIINSDGALANGILGYHDDAAVINFGPIPQSGDSPYCFVNLRGTVLSVADRSDSFALALSHEVAEMIADPGVSHTNPEICDGCAGNCNNDWRSYFSTTNGFTYLRSVKGGPPLSLVYDFFTAAVAQAAHVQNCPVSVTGCSYAPSAKADIGEILFYEQPTGYGTLWSENKNGEIALQTVNAWRQTWSQIIPGRFSSSNNGRKDVLFYSAQEGRGEFYQSGILGDIHQLAVTNGWRNDWGIIVPGNFTGSGFSDLLFYEPATGFAEFDRSDGKGNLTRISSFNNFRTSWTMILSGNFSNSPLDDLLFYDRAAGVVEFYKADGKGGISLLRNIGGLRTSWSIILAGNFSNSASDDLLFYDAASGVGEFYSVDATQGLKLMKSYSNFRQSWTFILKGRFSESPFDSLLFYDRSNGVGEFYQNDGKGGISLVKSHTDWRKTWSVIQSL